MWSLAATFAVILLAINVVLYLVVILPVRRLVGVANQVSLGQLDVGEVRVSGHDEISELATAFNRLFVSVTKAMKMLD
jgi:protein-histidine pros-kinase